MNQTTLRAIDLAVRLRAGDGPARREFRRQVLRSVLGGTDRDDNFFVPATAIMAPEYLGTLAEPDARVFALEWAMHEWCSKGFPLVVFPTMDDATALAETDPASWDTQNPFGGALGIEVGGSLIFLKTNWSASVSADPVVRKARLVILGECRLSVEQVERLTSNVLIALSERPAGLSITERRPSAKAARKRGRRYFPTTEYIIGATAPMWRSAPSGDGPSREGWTLSVRTPVRGHWRRQPFGRRSEHRKTIWICPHWKGPEDAPVSVHATLLTGRR